MLGISTLAAIWIKKQRTVFLGAMVVSQEVCCAFACYDLLLGSMKTDICCGWQTWRTGYTGWMPCWTTWSWFGKMLEVTIVSSGSLQWEVPWKLLFKRAVPEWGVGHCGPSIADNLLGRAWMRQIIALRGSGLAIGARPWRLIRW